MNVPVQDQIEHDGVEKELQPFLKWAGGKRWLVPDIARLIPRGARRYIEPFLGGGAIFFASSPRTAILSDSNLELIETYEAIKQCWEPVWDKLRWHQLKHSTVHYYSQRAKSETSLTSRAARFIYLNRACWNGLYRVNLKGQFNVPKGTKETIVFDNDNFEAIARSLQRTTLRCVDFEESINNAVEGDFVFLDPPYTVKHNLNGFVKYNEKLFGWDDQIRLRDAAVSAAKRGAVVVVTNADHRSIRNLYEKRAKIRAIKRASVLSGDSRSRGEVTELLITLP